MKYLFYVALLSILMGGPAQAVLEADEMSKTLEDIRADWERLYGPRLQLQGREAVFSEQDFQNLRQR